MKLICGQNRLADGNWGVETGEQDQLRYMNVATAVLSVCLYYLYCCGPPHYGDSDPLGTSFPEAEREGGKSGNPPSHIQLSCLLTRELMPQAADVARPTRT